MLSITKFFASLSVLLLIFSSSFAQNEAFKVEVVGKGKPILFIPGYSCSGDVWKETVANLSQKYECHVFTLAGFAGVKPIQDPILETVKNEIIKYVQTKKLEKPMVVGHSLGAFVTVWIASEKPELFGKLVCVDGVPFISALYNPAITVDSLKNNPQFNMATVKANFEALPNEGYIQQMTNAMLYQVSDTARAKQIATWNYESDRATLGAALIEMSLTDLREKSAAIKSEMLVLASLFGTEQQSQQLYKAQYAKVDNKTIKVAQSKHFIMYDQQEWFLKELNAFLN